MQMTILLINDNRNQHETFCEIVRRIDPVHKCLKHFSAESALEFLHEKDCVLPDLIFLDLVVRGTDGKQVLKELKKSAGLRDIPVCIYADSIEQSDCDETRKMGAIGYVTRQQNFTNLAESISSVIVAHL